MTTTTTLKKSEVYFRFRAHANRIRDLFVIIFSIFSTFTSYFFCDRMESFVFQQGYPFQKKETLRTPICLSSESRFGRHCVLTVLSCSNPCLSPTRYPFSNSIDGAPLSSTRTRNLWSHLSVSQPDIKGDSQLFRAL
jgi:hypothetical protein